MRALGFRCLGCLYYQGVYKCIVCPCMSCKVVGGPNPPITLKSLNMGKKNKKKGE